MSVITRRLAAAGCLPFLLLAPIVPSTVAHAATPAASGPLIIHSSHNDLSAPLASEEQGHDDGSVKQKPHRQVPGHLRQGRSSTPGTGTATTTAIPSTTHNFDGVGAGFTGPSGTFTVNSAPPDTNGATGPNHYIQIVNTDFAIFDKNATVKYGPVPINTLWSGFGGLCQTDNDGDPTVVYDRQADRFVISQFAVTGANGGSTPFLQCVAVSQTGDPTGSYFRYSFPYSYFNDYPKMAVWPDAYYVTSNKFNAAGTTFLGAAVAAMDRSKMLSGQPATQQVFSTSTTYGGLLASHLDGSQAPATGAPNHVVGLGATTSTLAYWNYHVDWTTPSNSSFSGPTELTVAPYAEACAGGTCIPQAGTSQQLDSLADRVMNRLAYRKFSDHEAMVVNHSVSAGSSVGVRWYELRIDSGNNLSVFQQGTYAPDSNYRWMGSIALDQAGNMALGYSVSSSSLHPEIRYTGRLAGDPAGSMAQGEATIIAGSGSQTGRNLSRWGDYSSMTVDPTDDCTFWYTNEYIPSNGAFNWKTRVGTFKFAGCGGAPPANDFSISASPSTLSVQQGGSATSTIGTAITSGVAQNVNLSASGLPSGTTASFNPASVNSGSSSVMTLNVGSSTGTGTYTITVTGTGTSATHTTTVSLTVTAAPPPGAIVNGGFETGNLNGWTSVGTTAVVTGGHSGTYAAQVGGTSPTSGDSSVAQTFTAPAGGALSFWYKVVCPDTLTYDWATATLKDNTANTTTTVLGKVCSNSGAWVQSAAGNLTGSHSYTLTLISHDDNYAGDATYTLYDDVTIGAAPPPPPGGITNGGFETGNLNGWTAAGTTAVVTGGHSGTYAARVGGTSPTNGDSSIAQTFTASTGSTKLSFWYRVTCPDTVTYDWATATLKDNTAGTTTTVLAKTCTNSGSWVQASGAVTAGHSYTLTLVSHDDNYAGDATYTLYDDVVLG